MRVGIIGAMDVEVATLVDALDKSTSSEHAGMAFHAGMLGPTEVVVVRSGVGKVSAAACTQILIDLFDVDAVINTGVAGSLDASIDIGDVVVSIDALHHDVDATIFGYELGEVPQLGTRIFPANATLRSAALEACHISAPDIHAFEGRVVSGDQFVADNATKQKLAQVFGGMCCEMEGAAIAQVCWLNRTPFVIIRAISDKADGSKQIEYPVFETKAAHDCAAIVEHMVKYMPHQLA